MKTFRIATILAACALAGCTLEAAQDEDLGEASLELVNEAAGNDIGPAALTWQLSAVENCMDVFEQWCSDSVPHVPHISLQCPDEEPEGLPCSPEFDTCWEPISASAVELYICVD